MKASLSSPVTGVEPDPRRAGTVRILVEGRAVLTVPVEVVQAEGIRSGVVPDAEQMGRLERAADHEAAFRTAVRLLARRPFARSDLARRLKLKGHLPDAASAALDRAAEAGYLDDAKFVRHYVESRSNRGRGPSRLRLELSAMGVERSLIDGALAALAAESAVDAQIDRLLARRLPLVRELPVTAARQRLTAFLARRGYRGDDARRKVLAATAEWGGAGSTDGSSPAARRAGRFGRRSGADRD
jgi:regulatory protein